jgi:hypothetical protein
MCCDTVEPLCPGGTVESSPAGTAGLQLLSERVPEGRLKPGLHADAALLYSDIWRYPNKLPVF